MPAFLSDKELFSEFAGDRFSGRRFSRLEVGDEEPGIEVEAALRDCSSVGDTFSPCISLISFARAVRADYSSCIRGANYSWRGEVRKYADSWRWSFSGEHGNQRTN